VWLRLKIPLKYKVNTNRSRILIKNLCWWYNRSKNQWINLNRGYRMDLVIRCLTKNYAKFSGRARRKEYWLYVLVVIIVFTVMVGFEMALDIQDQRTGLGSITVVLCLASIIPSLAVAVRRLHDTDRSGWWVLIYLSHLSVLSFSWFSPVLEELKGKMIWTRPLNQMRNSTHYREWF